MAGQRRDVVGDTGGPEAVAADFGLDSGLLRPASDRSPDVGRADRVAGELGVGPRSGAEEGALGIAGDAGGSDVLVEIRLQGMVGGHVVLLAAFLLEGDAVEGYLTFEPGLRCNRACYHPTQNVLYFVGHSDDDTHAFRRREGS
jgi:hypothetical protein